MTREQFQDAVGDFEALVLQGCGVEAALSSAEGSNGLRPGVLAARLGRQISLEDLVRKIRRDAEHNRFMSYLTAEMEKCAQRTGPYARLGILGTDSNEMLAEQVGQILGRPLTAHEVWIIEEKADPYLAEFRLARAAGTKPLRRFSID